MGIRKYLRTTALLCGIIACAPEPNTPADTNLGGVWVANAHLYSLSNFRLELIQEPRGIVSGKWFAKGDGGTGGCLPATPCDAFGELIGRNTVSGVDLELLGAGRFEGVLLESSRLRGVFSVGTAFDTITFNRFSNLASQRMQ